MDIVGNRIKRIDCSKIQNCFSFWDFEKNIEKRKRIEIEVENNIRIMYAYILNKRYIAGIRQPRKYTYTGKGKEIYRPAKQSRHSCDNHILRFAAQIMCKAEKVS